MYVVIAEIAVRMPGKMAVAVSKRELCCNRLELGAVVPHKYPAHEQDLEEVAAREVDVYSTLAAVDAVVQV